MANGFDAEFFRPFIEGTITTLKTTCSLDVTAGKPYLKSKQPSATEFQLAGLIGLTSDKFNGSIALCFTEQVFLKIMSNMLGEVFTEISEDLQSGAAELLNIIFGGAKTVLNQKGHNIQMARPIVIRGDALVTTHLGSGPVVVLPFNSALGTIHVEIATEGGKS